jgi:hypothetical protein
VADISALDRRKRRIRLALKGKPSARTQKRLRREYKSLRARQVAANAPERLTEPLTPRGLQSELQAAETLQFQPEQRAIEGQRRISEQMGRNIPAWYANYQNAVAGAARWQNATNQQLQQGIATRTKATSDQDAAQRQALVQKEEESARMRGATVDPSVERTAQQASTARRASSDAFANQAGLQGQTQAAYLGHLYRIGAGQQTEELKREAGRRRLIEQENQDLQTRRGAFRTEYTQKARERERQYGLERAAFGLKESEAVAEVQDEKRRRRLERARIKETRRAARERTATQRRGQDVTRRGQDLSHADRVAARNKPKGAPKGKSPFTPTQRRGAKSKFENALSFARQTGAKRGQGKQLVAALEGEGYDSLMAKAAAEQALYGGVSAATRNKIRKRYGFVPKLSPVKRKKAKLPKAVRGF